MGEELKSIGNYKSRSQKKGDAAACLRDSKAAQRAMFKFQFQLDFNLTLFIMFFRIILHSKNVIYANDHIAERCPKHTR